MEPSKKPNYLLISATIIQLIFLIVIGGIIVNVLNQDDRITTIHAQPKISIKGLSASNLSLSDEIVEELSSGLIEAIGQNTSNLNYGNSRAIVREGSIINKEFSRRGFNALSFIVDIPTLEQSYQIYYKDPINSTAEQTTENPYAILCLEDETQIIYPHFKCRSSYPKDTRQQIATDYIKFLEFDNFSIAIDDNDPTQININPIIDATDRVANEYIEQVKTSIRELGVSPELFKYHIIKKADLDYNNSF